MNIGASTSKGFSIEDEEENSLDNMSLKSAQLHTNETEGSTNPPGKKKNRRKTSHQVIMADDDITFECASVSSKNSGQNVPTDEKLMRKVAFLRSAVNYLMLHLGLTQFDYPEEVTFAWLRAEFQNKLEEKG